MITKKEVVDFPFNTRNFDRIKRLRYPRHRRFLKNHDALRGRILVLQPYNGHDAQKVEDDIMRILKSHKVKHPRSRVKGIISSIHGNYQKEKTEHAYLGYMMDIHKIMMCYNLGAVICIFPTLNIKESHSGATRAELYVGAMQHSIDGHLFVVVMEDGYPHPHRDYVETCISKYAPDVPIFKNIKEAILAVANLIDRDSLPHREEGD